MTLQAQSVVSLFLKKTVSKQEDGKNIDYANSDVKDSLSFAICADHHSSYQLKTGWLPCPLFSQYAIKYIDY